jgi:hypothetical protein
MEIESRPLSQTREPDRRVIAYVDEVAAQGPMETDVVELR